MPELPEVEAARRLMHSYSLGATISKAVVDNDAKVIDGVTAAALQEALTGKKIVAAHRKGKHMWLELNSGPHISFQFGMSGAIIVKGVKGPLYRNFKVSDVDEFPTSYSKVHLVLDSGTEVAFIDKRRFARVRLLDNPSKVAPISELGLDAYLELPSAKEMVEALKAKKQAVKALLLDQGYIAGIGNWVADEVLYQSKIHPEQPANSLKEEEVIRLHNVIKEVLEKAVAVDADSEQFPQSWLFHHRWGKGKAAASMADGNQVQHIDVSGRSSAYVPAVQKYSGPELKGAKTRLAAEENLAPAEEEEDDELDTEVAVETPKRGRGRPAKVKTDGAAAATSNDSPGSAKKRGRPPKHKTQEKKEASPGSTEPKKRGRPPKASKTDAATAPKTDAATASKTEAAASKTEAAASKEAVNKALEEAPVEEEAEAGSPVTPKRRGRPSKAAKTAEDPPLKPKTAEEAPKPKTAEDAPKAAKTEDISENIVSKKAKVSEDGASVPVVAEQPKKGRGRPAKPKPATTEAAAVASSAPAPPAEAAAAAATSTPTPKKRGRPSTKQQA